MEKTALNLCNHAGSLSCMTAAFPGTHHIFVYQEIIMIRIHTRLGLGVLVLAGLISPLPSLAGSADDISALKRQLHQTREMLKTMQKRLLQLEQKQGEQLQAQKQIQATVQQQGEAVAEVAASASTSGSSSPNAFNPEISAVLNGKYQSFSQSPDNFAIPGFLLGDGADLGGRGFALSESELDVASNVDNLFYGSLTISLQPTGGADVEEAFLQTLELPLGLTLKAGRFFSGIGYLNQFHAHHDDFIDRPLPYRAFLNSQYGDDGVQIKWLAPTDTFLELGGEVLRGDAFPSGGAANDGAGTWRLFAHVGGDVGISNSWKAGISYLHSHVQQRDSLDSQGYTFTFKGNSRLWLADFVWKWAPDGNPVNRHFRFQTELFHRDEDGQIGSPAALYDGSQFGWYAEGVYQFIPRWKIGLRHAELSANNHGTAVTPGGLLDDSHKPHRDSLVLGFSNSEFSRIRLQLARDVSQPRPDYQLSLQYLMLLGAHGAHQF